MTTITSHPARRLAPPGPSGAAGARWLLRLHRDPLGTFEAIAETYGNVAQIRAGGSRVVCVRGASAARHVVLGAQDNYRKGTTFELFRPILGMGLVTSEGEQWRTSRRMVQPLFAKRHLGVYADHMSSAAADALARWDRDWAEGQAVTLDHEILDVGFDTIGRALVSGDLGRARSRESGDAFNRALDELGHLLTHPLLASSGGALGRGMQETAKVVAPRRWRRYVGHADAITAMSTELVDHRYAHGQGERDDLLRLLMESQDLETGARLSRQQVLDELRTFIAAGHETTAHGLSWMLYLLAQHPADRARVEDELDRVLGGRPPTADTAEQLPYFTACFQEALRLYPPAWVLPRVAVEDDEIDGRYVRRGSGVLVSIWATHRDPNVYPEPGRFDPARWLGGAPADRPRFSYLPFGGGRRACIGQGFAMLNARILGAMVMQRYRFDVIDDRPVELHTSITLRSTHGLAMTAHRR